jgi:hypothetical protein
VRGRDCPGDNIGTVGCCQAEIAASISSNPFVCLFACFRQYSIFVLGRKSDFYALHLSSVIIAIRSIRLSYAGNLCLERKVTLHKTPGSIRSLHHPMILISSKLYRAALSAHRYAVVMHSRRNPQSHKGEAKISYPPSQASYPARRCPLHMRCRSPRYPISVGLQKIGHCPCSPGKIGGSKKVYVSTDT